MFVPLLCSCIALTLVPESWLGQRPQCPHSPIPCSDAEALRWVLLLPKVLHFSCWRSPQVRGHLLPNPQVSPSNYYGSTWTCASDIRPKKGERHKTADPTYPQIQSTHPTPSSPSPILFHPLCTLPLSQHQTNLPWQICLHVLAPVGRLGFVLSQRFMAFCWHRPTIGLAGNGQIGCTKS